MNFDRFDIDRRGLRDEEFGCQRNPEPLTSSSNSSREGAIGDIVAYVTGGLNSAAEAEMDFRFPRAIRTAQKYLVADGRRPETTAVQNALADRLREEKRLR